MAIIHRCPRLAHFGKNMSTALRDQYRTSICQNGFHLQDPCDRSSTINIHGVPSTDWTHQRRMHDLNLPLRSTSRRKNSAFSTYSQHYENYASTSPPGTMTAIQKLHSATDCASCVSSISLLYAIFASILRKRVATRIGVDARLQVGSRLKLPLTLREIT